MSTSSPHVSVSRYRKSCTRNDTHSIVQRIPIFKNFFSRPCCSFVIVEHQKEARENTAGRGEDQGLLYCREIDSDSDLDFDSGSNSRSRSRFSCSFDKNFLDLLVRWNPVFEEIVCVQMFIARVDCLSELFYCIGLLVERGRMDPVCLVVQCSVKKKLQLYSHTRNKLGRTREVSFFFFFKKKKKERGKKKRNRVRRDSARPLQNSSILFFSPLSLC